ncbi:MAG: ABC transporter permease, partial [Bryobacteraceae bacterium]
MSWLSRLGNVFRGERLDRDLLDELEFHIEARTEDLIRSGMDPHEAAVTARRAFGNPLAVRERSRDTKVLRWLESFLQDVRFGLRTLRKDRAVTIAAVATLSLAIGACTAAFTLIDALLLRPLPLPEPERLVELSYPKLRVPFPGAPAEDYRFSYLEYERFRSAGSGQLSLFAITLGMPLQSVVFQDAQGELERVRTQWISSEGFGILRVRPALGRLLTADDETSAVLSRSFWKSRFAEDASVLGRWMTWNGRQFQIVGVVQDGFSGVEPGMATDLWLPLKTLLTARQMANPKLAVVNVMGRMEGDASIPSMQSRLQVVFTNGRREVAQPELRLNLKTAAHGHQTFAAWQFAKPLWFLAAVVGLILLITCANLANLLVARTAARTREMAMRAAIGAGRGRLIQQILVESSLLAALACLIGFAFAVMAAPALVSLLQSSQLPVYLDLQPDGRALGFLAVLAGIATILFGIGPALRASGVVPNEVLKTGSSGHSTPASLLKPVLVAQLAFSFAVLFVAGLLLLSFQKLTSVELGFAKEGVVLFSLHSSVKSPGVQTELLERLRHFPGVAGASASDIPLVGGAYFPSMRPGIRIPGRPADAMRPQYMAVASGFFTTMQIRLLAGREFAAQDGDAVIVNDSFAHHYFPGEDPLGKRFERET